MRALNAAAISLLGRALAGEQVPIVQLVHFAWSVPQYHSTGGYALQWNGVTWQATGIGIEPVQDAADDDPTDLVISLPAVTGPQLALALVEPIDGTDVHIYDAIVDPATAQVVHAELVWSGTCAVPGINDGDEAVLGVVCEHRAARAWRPKPARYTNDEQLRRYPGDTSLDYDPATDAADVVWPAAAFFAI